MGSVLNAQLSDGPDYRIIADLGDFVLRHPYGIYDDGPRIAIHRADGEGGDFSLADFNAAIASFYDANF